MLRRDMLERIRSREQWDIIVIGGGATGLGTAVDAAARGYKTLLLEAFDFAKGTSSRSTKLIHGGVRYLQQGNLALVREGLYERGLLGQNAPHIVHPLAFVIPAYKWWATPFYGAGLLLYDQLAGKLGIGATRILSHWETLRQVPTLEPKDLWGGIMYYDGQFDDARLATTLLRTLIDLDGTALNYLPAIGLTKQGSRISGVLARDPESGEEFELRARVVVNATGAFVDTLRHMDDPKTKGVLALSQGVHLVLPRSFLPGNSAIMIPHTDDGRVLFAIPWHERVLIGTTDTPIQNVSNEPRAMAAEVEFLLKHTARYFTQDPKPTDVCSVFAGIRPLVKSGNKATATLSRDHTLMVSPSGLVTITGGKWTIYRRMGADTVTRAAEVGGLPKRPSVTATLKLHGWQPDHGDGPLALYGSDGPAVQQVLNERPGWDQLLHPDLPYRVGEVAWAARYEFAQTVEDVLSRRTRALLLNARASATIAPRVAEILAGELQRDHAWQQAEVTRFRDLAQEYILTP